MRGLEGLVVACPLYKNFLNLQVSDHDADDSICHQHGRNEGNIYYTGPSVPIVLDKCE
jgi:hypothetical protein